MHIKERIRKRRNFSDVDMRQNVSYEPYKKIPLCTGFARGKNCTEVFRNKHTGELEQLKYKLIGSVPFEKRPGHYWYWGQIEAEDSDTRNACLAFYFDGEGDLRSITASFCSRNPSSESFRRMNSDIKYAAQITTRGVG